MPATPWPAGLRGSSPTPQPSPRTPRPHRGPPSHPPEGATTGLASSPASISACTWPASYGGAPCVGQQLSALPFIDACTMTLSRLTIFHSPSPWSTRANMTQTCRQRWPSTRGQLHPDRLCDDPWLLHPPFFLVALTATLLPLQPVGPDGLRIMIGASARQEPGFRGHPPGSWRKPRVPSHCYDDAAQFREAVFSGASPVRVR